MASKFDFDSLVAVCLRTHEEIQHQAARSINLSLVVRNWLFGWYIVEYEQHGTDRAEYGARFIESLSARLRQAGIKGGSRTRLQLYRSFYLNYKQICPTVSGEFAMLPYRGERLPEGMLSSLANVYDDRILIWNSGTLPDNWTAAQLKAKHPSKPFNPDVANVFFRAGTIEAWGRGIERMCADCADHGVPEPVLQCEPDGMWVEFPNRTVKSEATIPKTRTTTGVKPTKLGQRRAYEAHEAHVEAHVQIGAVELVMLRICARESNNACSVKEPSAMRGRRSPDL
ncbi:MAG: DUF1016 family protein [Planctomycetaceae bacterium]|nr:MAG: DUF1016 family protein [Planctomycetaceae bacterium]